MTLALVWLWLFIKRILKNPLFIVFMAAYPFVCSTVSTASYGGSIKAAVYFEEYSDFGFGENLINNNFSNGTINFYKAESKDKLISDVMSEKAECGYVFKSGFKSTLDSGKVKKSIELYTSPSTILSEVINEIVFAEILSVYGGDILVSEAQKNGYDTYDLKQRYEQYMSDGGTFSFKYTDKYIDSQYNNSSQNKKSSPSVFSINGLTAVFIFISALYGGVIFLNDKKLGLYGPSNSAQKFIGAYMSALSCAIVAAFSGFIALLVSNSSVNLFSFVIYIAASAAFVSAAVPILKTPELFGAFITFMAIGSVVVCPIFIDLGTLIPHVRALRAAFIPYYMIYDSPLAVASALAASIAISLAVWRINSDW